MNKGGNTGIILVLYIRIRRFPFFILVSFFRRKMRKSPIVVVAMGQRYFIEKKELLHKNICDGIEADCDAIQ